MLVKNKPYRTIWSKKDNRRVVQIIDQRALPFQFIIEDINTVADMVVAIRDMHLRGAGLIGAAGAFGLYLAALESEKETSFDTALMKKAEMLKKTRPTAVNLAWAIDRCVSVLQKVPSVPEKINTAYALAHDIADEEAEKCRKIGLTGLPIIEAIAKKKKGKPVNILTHCNAGWLAFVDYGSATAPFYEAHRKKIPLHVWVDETRPRNQGARLTAWELKEEGVPHTVISDNTGGHLMQKGLVDMVIVGTDRTTREGDVCNKIGTYLKALAAKDNGVPFYVALPSSSVDWSLRKGSEIPIEERNSEEVSFIEGWNGKSIDKVQLSPTGSAAANYAFDVTPARLVTGLITERGICNASEEGLLTLFPEKK